MKLTLIFQEKSNWMPAVIWAIPTQLLTGAAIKDLTERQAHTEEVDVEVWTVKNLLYNNYPYYITWCWPMLDGRLHKLDSQVASSVYTFSGVKMDTCPINRVDGSSADEHPFFKQD